MNIFSFTIIAFTVLCCHIVSISAQDGTESTTKPENNPSEAQQTSIEEDVMMMDDPKESMDKTPKEVKPKQNDPPAMQQKLENPSFKCSILEMCDVDDPNAKILGILEEKVIKLEKTVDKLLKKLDELEGESKNKTDKIKTSLMEEMQKTVEKCQCNNTTIDNTNTENNDPMKPPIDNGQSRSISPVPENAQSSTNTPPSPSADATTTAKIPTTPPSNNENPPTEEEFHPLKTMGPNPRCLESTGGMALVKRCKPNSALQEWSMRPDGTFQNRANGLCLEGGSGGEVGVVAVPCDTSSKTQQWEALEDNSIKNRGNFCCLSNGAYGAITAECDGNFWQQYDYLRRIREPGIVFVTYHLKKR